MCAPIIRVRNLCVHWAYASDTVLLCAPSISVSVQHKRKNYLIEKVISEYAENTHKELKRKKIEWCLSPPPQKKKYLIYILAPKLHTQEGFIMVYKNHENPRDEKSCTWAPLRPVYI
jgi:hypothetical protein